MKATEARKVSEKVVARQEGKQWNFLDTLQLAWYKKWIKFHTKRGKKFMISSFTPRILVAKELQEKEGFYVWKSIISGCVIRW